MVVKSATKKRLLDMGIPEENAHALANDRKMADLYIMDTNHFAEIVGKKKQLHRRTGLKTRDAYIQSVRKLSDRYWVRIQFHRFLIDYFKKNPLPFVVARPSPRSSLIWRHRPIAVILNRRWLVHDDAAHDYDKLMSMIQTKISTKVFENASPHNSDWYLEYYEWWVQKNTGS